MNLRAIKRRTMAMMGATVSTRMWRSRLNRTMSTLLESNRVREGVLAELMMEKLREEKKQVPSQADHP
jgi:hypothetical protein